ncbi:hypothetical protein H5T89_04375 [bacterium]|nr:hypothetical protein [bacterium]
MPKVHKDFHGALSCAFQFLEENYGKEALTKFLIRVAQNCYKDLISNINTEGLLALEIYWRKIFTLEEGKFEIRTDENSVIIEVKECPALSHLKKAGYPIYKDFCYQTEIINSIIAKETGLYSSIEKNQDKAYCIQKFWREK